MRSWRISLAAFGVPILAGVAAIAGPAVAQAQTYSNFVNVNSGKCLDVYNWSKQPGAFIDQWTCGNNQANQSWTDFSEPGPNNYVGLVNENSGECLTAPPSAGVDVSQEPCSSGDPLQEWTITPAGSGAEWKNVNSGLYLEVYGGSRNNEAVVDTWYLNGNSNQKWYFG